mgnify:CR=1 FL=1|tara:strand:- start:60038 stop:61900 length:1863 start_codon:yes stop_codon:yes gene_type:complete
MKNYKLKIVIILGLLFSFSCEDYLDIAPESVLDQEEVFSTFDNAQGFVEEMYALVVDYGTAGHTFQDYIFGDDAYHAEAWKASGKIDRGQLDWWSGGSLSYLGTSDRVGGANENTNEQQARGRPRVWEASMQGIRKANTVLESEDLMIGLSQEEKNVILGQAYFFRGYFHFQVMKFWGRFPHIQEVFFGEVTIQRPDTYRESALSITEDFNKAIDLLPVNWDTEPYGRKTLGENAGRATKGAAYAFKGKNLLFAASPLMYFNNQPGIDTYTYDTELAEMAVDAFAGVLKLVDQGVYDFANANQYEEVFWKTPNNNMWPGLTPGAKELIFSAPGGHQLSAERFMSAGVPRSINGVSGSAMNSPTHNFIQNNFGMANGLSIEDDLSGQFGTPTYNPNRPFDNRDPRFYKWIVIDREVVGTKATIPNNHKNMQLYIGGIHRQNGSSITGYGYKKFYPVLEGEFHSNWNRIISNYVGMRIVMRVTDVYLMYAEALHASKGSTTAPGSYSLTAEQVINKIRARAGVGTINSSIVADNNKFMDELRRERAVELSYEAHRWVDIRRWGVAHLDKYRIKTALDFDKEWTFFDESVLVDRVCEYPKHYWLPFQANQTQFYEGFPQNPGW